MTDNEIIKALDVLKSWQRLAYHNDDGTDEDSHELYIALTIMFEYINRQKAEIERLKNEMLKIVEHDIPALAAKQIADTHTANIINHARAEAIKEFAERLKNVLTSCNKTIDGESEYHICDYHIDDLVKEMVGDE